MQFFERRFRDHVVGYALLEGLGEPRGLLDLPLVPVRERPLLHFALDLLPQVGVLPEDERPITEAVFKRFVRLASLSA